MTIASRLLGKRGISPNQIWGAGLDDLYRGQTAAGINVTAEQAMTSAVGKCIRLLADDIAQLPVDFYRKAAERNVPLAAPEWYTYPTTRRWDTWPDHITEVVVSLLGDGNAFIQGLPQTFNPEYLYVLDPAKTDVRELAGRASITYGGAELGDADVAHLKWVRLPGKLRGINVVEASKESVGLELAAREWAASFFANGATLSGLIKVPQGVVMTDEAKNGLRDAFATQHVGRRKSHAFGILTGGADFSALTINPQQAELNALWQHVLEEAASIFHIPPHMLASQTPSGQSYASVEQKSIEYVIHAIVPIVRRLEAAYSRFIPGDDTFVKFNVNALLRGDAWSRAQVHAAYLQNKVITRDEVRRLEDLAPADEAIGLGSENGGFLETPNNNSGQGDSPAAQAAPDKGDARAVVQIHADNVHTDSMTLDGAPLAPLLERQNALFNEQNIAIRKVANQPPPVVNVPAPVVNVPAPVVNVPAPIVNVQERAMPDFMTVSVLNEPSVHVKSAPRRRIVKDAQGKPEAAVDG